MLNYTIPRNNRELQRGVLTAKDTSYYTIPRNNRELQHKLANAIEHYDYTIPRNNRELQPMQTHEDIKRIIPYQEIIGNYS